MPCLDVMRRAVMQKLGISGLCGRICNIPGTPASITNEYPARFPNLERRLELTSQFRRLHELSLTVACASRYQELNVLRIRVVMELPIDPSQTSAP
jgi:hypothetical protein